MDRMITCCIRIGGQLGPEWSSWFEGLAIEPELDGTTRLSGRLVDQAALHGVLAAIQNLGLTLVSITSSVATEPSSARGE